MFIPLIWFFYPETQNLSLEQVDLLFTGEQVLLHWKPSMGERQGSFSMAAAESLESEIVIEKSAAHTEVQHVE